MSLNPNAVAFSFSPKPLSAASPSFMPSTPSVAVPASPALSSKAVTFVPSPKAPAFVPGKSAPKTQTVKTTTKTININESGKLTPQKAHNKQPETVVKTIKLDGEGSMTDSNGVRQYSLDELLEHQPDNLTEPANLPAKLHFQAADHIDQILAQAAGNDEQDEQQDQNGEQLAVSWPVLGAGQTKLYTRAQLMLVRHLVDVPEGMDCKALGSVFSAGGGLQTGLQALQHDQSGGRSMFGTAPRPTHNHQGQGPGPNNRRNNNNQGARGFDRSAFGRAAGQARKPRPPVDHFAKLKRAENRWGKNQSQSDQEKIVTTLRALMNKLSADKYDFIVEKTALLDIQNADTLTQVVTQIFAKAIDEPPFAPLYARYCTKLYDVFPEFHDDENKPINFRTKLLELCYAKLTADDEDIEGFDEMSPKDQQLAQAKVKRHTVGNLKMIGELFKQKLIQDKVLHSSIEILLDDEDGIVESDVEALVTLLETCGRELEESSEESGKLMQSYFEKIGVLSKDSKRICSRVRFSLMDLIEMRKKSWTARVDKSFGTQTKEEFHKALAKQEAEKQVKLKAERAREDAKHRDSRHGGGRRHGGRDDFRGRDSRNSSRGYQKGKPQDIRGGGSRNNSRANSLTRKSGSRKTTPLNSPRRKPKVQVDDDGWGTVQTGKAKRGSGKPSRGPSPKNVSDNGAWSKSGSSNSSSNNNSKTTTSSEARFAARATGGNSGSRFGNRQVANNNTKQPKKEKMVAKNAFAGLDDSESEDESSASSSSESDTDSSVTSAVASLSIRSSGSGYMPPHMRKKLAAEQAKQGAKTAKQAPKEPESEPEPEQPTPEEAASTAQDAVVAEQKRKCKAIIDEYLNVWDVNEATLCVKELAMPEAHAILVSKAMTLAFEGKDAQRSTDLLVKWFKQLGAEELLTKDQFQSGVERFASILDDFSLDVPNAWKFLALVLGNAAADGLLDLAKVTPLLVGLTYQGRNRQPRRCIMDAFIAVRNRDDKTSDDVVALWQSSDVNLLSLFAEKEQTKEALAEQLKDRELPELAALVL